jgi:hypothetical protein
MHRPAQSLNPAGHRHLPASHDAPPLHATPQPPQFEASVVSSTQLRPHATEGAVQVLTHASL